MDLLGVCGGAQPWLGGGGVLGGVGGDVIFHDKEENGTNSRQ